MNEKTNINPDSSPNNQGDEALESIRTRIAEKLGNFVTQRTIRNKENTEKDTTRQSRKEYKVLKKINEMNEKEKRRNEKDERRQRWTEVKESKKEEERNEKVRKRADRIEDQRRTVLLLEGVYGREAGRHSSLSSRTSGEYAKYKQQKKDLKISLNNGSISPVAYSEKLKMYQGEYENKRKPQRRVYKAEKKLRRLSERYYGN